MSKAFTKETDGADDDEGLALPPLPPGGKNYITPSGYARLRAELLDLIDNERPKIVDVVHWAASNGDRSENGDYLYGKKRLREIDRRIRFLTKRLEIAEVVDPSLHAGSEQVFFGATVTYSDDEDGERKMLYFAPKAYYPAERLLDCYFVIGAKGDHYTQAFIPEWIHGCQYYNSMPHPFPDFAQQRDCMLA